VPFDARSARLYASVSEEFFCEPDQQSQSVFDIRRDEQRVYWRAPFISVGKFIVVVVSASWSEQRSAHETLRTMLSRRNSRPASRASGVS